MQLVSRPGGTWLRGDLTLFIAWLMAILFTMYVSSGGSQPVDTDVAWWCFQHVPRTGWLWQLLVLLTGLGSIATMAVLALVGCVWQAAVGNWRTGVLWLILATAVGGFLDLAVKNYIARPRPPAEWRDRAVLEDNASYPSGHAMGSMIGYGMFAFCLRRQRLCWSLVASWLLLVLILAIGASRVCLRAHYLSDVIGGLLLGAWWLYACKVVAVEVDRCPAREV